MTGTFLYKERIYPYLSAAYNGTRLNERAVEVPPALAYLNQAWSPLEVGAVLPHYIPDWTKRVHTCIDLYEEYPSVINVNVLDYRPYNRFDLIVCISTLDHLDNADEVLEAVGLMKSWLERDGLLYITLPYGQPESIGGGPWLDELVLRNRFNMRMMRLDKVQDVPPKWEEGKGEPKEYSSLGPNANTVFLMEWHR